MKKHSYILRTVIIGAVVLSLCLSCWFHTPIEYSDSERRALVGFPELTIETVLSGEFMTEFESYSVDQFPLRDLFRTVKALSSSYLFGQLDNNQIYVTNGVASKIEYPLNNDSLSHAADKFQFLYDTYMSGTDNRVFLSVVPDKNALIAKESGRLSMDYEAFYEQMKTEVPFAEYVDIAPLMDAEDYYATDTHWRQESITDVADTLAAAMGTTLPKDSITHTLDTPFYGVYHGQSALPLEPDTIRYLTNDTIDAMTAYNHESNAVMPIYDMEKAYGKDSYELFLSGSVSLITIQNPLADTDKDLIVFRDSFGSSLIPLLAQGYSTVTVVDIRYLPSVSLANYIDFDDQDVLFLYSTLVLNNSNTLK